jgi:ornithine cyclodeaminase/alanine dehydrogenase-like protein (mu-crystallin family)
VSALYLDDDDIRALLSPEVAIGAVSAALARAASEHTPHLHPALPDGRFAVAACVDAELGLAGLESEIETAVGVGGAVLLFSAEHGRLEAVVEAPALGRLRRAAAAAVAAGRLAAEGAESLGVIGCGEGAAVVIACMRAALPTIARVVVAGGASAELEAFCRGHGCSAAASNREAAEQLIVVTATSAHDPVLRGEWLSEGALVIALGARDAGDRELDNTAIERASFICCDSREQARREAGDLIEPVSQGALDWLEVHELGEVVAAELQGRASAADIVLFVCSGLAVWNLALAARALELARTQGRGRAL